MEEKTAVEGNGQTCRPELKATTLKTASISLHTHLQTPTVEQTSAFIYSCI